MEAQGQPVQHTKYFCLGWQSLFVVLNEYRFVLCHQGWWKTGTRGTIRTWRKNWFCLSSWMRRCLNEKVFLVLWLNHAWQGLIAKAKNYFCLLFEHLLPSITVPRKLRREDKFLLFWVAGLSSSLETVCFYIINLLIPIAWTAYPAPNKIMKSKITQNIDYQRLSIQGRVVKGDRQFLTASILIICPAGSCWELLLLLSNSVSPR